MYYVVRKVSGVERVRQHILQLYVSHKRVIYSITWSEKSEESKGRDDNAPPPAAPASEVGIISCVCVCVCVCVCMCVCGERERERERERGERRREREWEREGIEKKRDR